VNVFLLDPEAGELRFGDGAHGGRPIGEMRGNYDVSVGAPGNVGPDTINRAATLPAGIAVTNPIRTWGGADAETVLEGEKQITRYLQHRDRLVTARDFETIALRAPGADIGRVEVIAAYNPALIANEPGDAAGAVTLMVIPRSDPDHPDAPEPDRLFLEALCRHLEPRRLLTTEVFLRSPDYKDVWISVGIDVVPGFEIAVVREAVRTALARRLSPLPADPEAGVEEAEALLTTPQYVTEKKGWPLRKPVDALELMAVASRVPGVRLVKQLYLAEGTQPPTASLGITGLELPRVRGIAVAVGDASSLDEVRGQAAPAMPVAGAPSFVPLPVIPPEEC
jgi:predicted phage baseplate assembly protein